MSESTIRLKHPTGFFAAGSELRDAMVLLSDGGFNRDGGSPVTSLHYFAGPLEEVAGMELNMNYWRYLAARVKKMQTQWRAQANLARAAGAKSAGNEIMLPVPPGPS